MPDRVKPCEVAKMMFGSALMELRVHDERRARIVTRLERAYALWLDLIGGSEDPEVVVDEA